MQHFGKLLEEIDFIQYWKINYYEHLYTTNVISIKFVQIDGTYGALKII